MATNLRTVDEAAIDEAAALIRAGGLVAFPTETVYGLGADATNDRAVADIFEAKGRPRFNPLIVHFSGLDDIAAEVEMDDRARALAAAFWPGPLTLVLTRKPASNLSRLVSAGLDTVAVRLPAHPIARELIAAAHRPLAAPSANRSGDISPTNADHVARSLGAGPALILDGGATKIGIESTVVDLSTPMATLLRPGAVTVGEIVGLIGALDTAPTVPGGGPEKSPGRQERHYAPRHPLRINVTAPEPGEALLAFGPRVPKGAGPTLNLSPNGDVGEAAANLFAMLHELDAQGCDGIAAMPVPETGLGAAINDRLRRAAHPLAHAP
ncbi:MAG: L-threonylcarbamoyladenylate synthase [Alphaproteobacteria bacterium]|nr:L-threonylcarbamoyladenylate synthase [Alphaproteobacteria bacterium]